MKFWDASAIVPLLVEEPPHSAAVRRWVRDDRDMLVWWSTSVECVSAIARRERDGAFAPNAVSRALDRLQKLSEQWHEVLPNSSIRRAAERMLRVHPLRAADALQLAAAVVVAEHEPATLEFVCMDDRLSEAASKEGFTLARPVGS